MSETSSSPRTIIIVRKAKHDDFHGGSWKVALADFMTAMFALFLTLWILTQSQEVKTAVAAYFRHPTEYEGKPDTIFRGNDGLFEHRQGRLDNEPVVIDAGPGGKEMAPQTPQSVSGSTTMPQGSSGVRPKADMERPEDEQRDEITTFLRVADTLWKKLGVSRQSKDSVRIETHEEGLLIQLVAQPNVPLLDERGSNLSAPIREALGIIGRELGKSTGNKVEISGHNWTAEDPTRKWVSSADLADLARAEMERAGLRAAQVSRVAGCADARPLNPGLPRDPLNQRVSILFRPRQWQPEAW